MAASQDNTVTPNTGDNAEDRGDVDGRVISSGLRATGACMSVHLTPSSHDVASHDSKLTQLSHNSSPFINHSDSDTDPTYLNSNVYCREDKDPGCLDKDYQLTDLSYTTHPLTEYPDRNSEFIPLSNNSPQLTDNSDRDSEPYNLNQTAHGRWDIDSDLIQLRRSSPHLTECSNRDSGPTQLCHNSLQHGECSGKDSVSTQLSSNSPELAECSDRDSGSTQLRPNSSQLAECSDIDSQLTHKFIHKAQGDCDINYLVRSPSSPSPLPVTLDWSSETSSTSHSHGHSKPSNWTRALTNDTVSTTGITDQRVNRDRGKSSSSAASESVNSDTVSGISDERVNRGRENSSSAASEKVNIDTSSATRISDQYVNGDKGKSFSSGSKRVNSDTVSTTGISDQCVNRNRQNSASENVYSDTLSTSLIIDQCVYGRSRNSLSSTTVSENVNSDTISDSQTNDRRVCGRCENSSYSVAVQSLKSSGTVSTDQCIYGHCKKNSSSAVSHSVQGLEICEQASEKHSEKENAVNYEQSEGNFDLVSKAERVSKGNTEIVGKDSSEQLSEGNCELVGKGHSKLVTKAPSVTSEEEYVQKTEGNTGQIADSAISFNLKPDKHTVTISSSPKERRPTPALTKEVDTTTHSSTTGHRRPTHTLTKELGTGVDRAALVAALNQSFSHRAPTAFFLPDSQPDSQPTSQPIIQTASQPGCQQTSQETVQPVRQSSSQLASQSGSKPSNQSASQPDNESQSQLTFQRASPPTSRDVRKESDVIQDTAFWKKLADRGKGQSEEKERQENRQLPGVRVFSGTDTGVKTSVDCVTADSASVGSQPRQTGSLNTSPHQTNTGSGAHPTRQQVSGKQCDSLTHSQLDKAQDSNLTHTNQSQLCKTLAGKVGERGEGSNISNTHPLSITRHSWQPSLVAKETASPTFGLQTACHESFLCGGAVSVLPPIVERAEADVTPSPPITDPAQSDVTGAMLSGWEVQKVDASRGKRVVVEPFFQRKLAQQCVASKTGGETDSNSNRDTALDNTDVCKVRKTGSHQLPTFVLRQTSFGVDKPSPGSEKTSSMPLGRESSIMSSSKDQGTGNPGGGEKKVERGSVDSEESAISSSRTPASQEERNTHSRLTTPKINKTVYDVCMDEDTIRVDINPQHSPSPDNETGSRRTKSLSVAEEDDFQENRQSFQEWSEQKIVRQQSRQDGSKQAKPSTVQFTEKNASLSKLRTSSDGALLNKITRHYSIEDDLDDDITRVSHMRLRGHTSLDSTMSPRRHSLAVNLDSERTRRNSVTILRARPKRVSSPLSRSVSPSDRMSSAPRRRHSSKTTLEKFLRQSSQATSRPDIASSLEFLTWTHLLSTYPHSQLSNTTVERSEVVVTIPVCHVTRAGSSVSVTSVEAIEQTLTTFHPTLQVLLNSLAPGNDLPSASPGTPQAASTQLAPGSAHSSLAVSSQPGGVHSSPVSTQLSPGKGHPSLVVAEKPPVPGGAHPSVHVLDKGLVPPALMVNMTSEEEQEQQDPPLSPSQTEDANDEMTDLTVSGKRGADRPRKSNNMLSTGLKEEPRRVSINTCIRTMREGSGNYDSQLIGCQNVGTYAEEETLKVVLAKSDAISCVISAMKAFIEKEELQLQACASLLKMASASEANCRYISEKGGVRAITCTMRRYETHVDITRQALSILGYISAADNLKAELLGYGCHSDVLAAMSRHSDDRTIVCQCCFILGNLVISVETAQQLMLVGAVHTIISMVKRYHDDRDIQENGCRALGSFALYDETCVDVAQAGATQTVMAALTSDLSDVSVLESACWALACLTCKGVTCEEVVMAGGVKMIVEIMERHPEEEHLQEYAVRVLCNLATPESTASGVSNIRVVDALISVYHHFAHNVELMEYIMLAVSLVASVDAEVQHYLLRAGMVKKVVAVMRSLEENPVIQENGCRTLGNMAVNESLRKLVEEQGASQAVTAAMLNIDMCADIQLYGCMALMNLTADLMDNKMRVKNNGAVPILLTTLRNFPDNSEVVLSALKTLGNLVDLEEACRQLLDDKGLATIITIARDNHNDPNIRAFAALVLSGLTALSDLAVEDLLTIEETLVTLQAALPHDPDLALSMCHGLHNLLKSEVGLETLVQTSWMEVIANTTNTFTTQPDIHLTACRIVGTVAMECGRRLEPGKCPLSVSTVRSVLQSMRQFPDHKDLLLVGCGTLSCVADIFGHLRKTIIQEGGMRDVTTAMTSFPNDDRLHSVGLIALSYLLPDDVHADPRDEDLAMDVIARSMSQFVENDDIQITACRALERCRVKDMNNVNDVLTCVHNAVRRHSAKEKVVRAASKVFARFAGEKGESITQEIVSSPTKSAKDVLAKLMQK